MIVNRGLSGLHLRNTAVTVGKFDGLHAGHQLILERLREYGEKGLETCVVTIVSEGNGIIYSEEEKVLLLQKAGIDRLIVLPFDDSLASMEADEFVKNVLVDGLGMAAAVVGDDFRFGHNRTGDPLLLKKLGEEYGFTTDVIVRLKNGGEPVSSTLIRNLLKSGDKKRAAELLNKHYFDGGSD